MTTVTPVSNHPTYQPPPVEEPPPPNQTTSSSESTTQQNNAHPASPLTPPPIVNSHARAIAQGGPGAVPTQAPRPTSAPAPKPAIAKPQTTPNDPSGSGFMAWINNAAAPAKTFISNAVNTVVKAAPPPVRNFISSAITNQRALDTGLTQTGASIDSQKQQLETHIDSTRTWLQTHLGPVGQASSAALGFGEGVADAAYNMGKGIVQGQADQMALMNPVEWAANPGANIDRINSTINKVVTLSRMANLTQPASWIADPQGNSQLASSLWNSGVKSFQSDPSKFTGNAAATVASLLVPGGEVEAAADAAEVTDVATQATEAADMTETATSAGELGKNAPEPLDISQQPTQPLSAVNEPTPPVSEDQIPTQPSLRTVNEPAQPVSEDQIPTEPSLRAVNEPVQPLSEDQIPTQPLPTVNDSAPNAIDAPTQPTPVIQTAPVDAVQSAAEPRDLLSMIRDVNPMFGRTNCLNCSIAVDMRLGQGVRAIAAESPATSLTVLEQHFGGQFSWVTGPDQVEAELLAAGPDARGIVYGMRADRTAHVFNAINDAGSVYYLDGQSGTFARVFDDFTHYAFLRTH